VTTTASGRAERRAALALIEPHADTLQPVTLRADRGCDSADFVMQLRDRAVTPHVAQNTSGRRSAIDGPTIRHPGYAVSQRIRKRESSSNYLMAITAVLPKLRIRCS